jgi:hypothetical protein
MGWFLFPDKIRTGKRFVKAGEGEEGEEER